MTHSHWKALAASALLLPVTQTAFAHGLVDDPPSRNWFCGVETKPDQALYGDPEHAECADAFENDQDGGYQFMSVLTHDRGSAEVEPLPDNVCGFDSETWDGGSTPWDEPIDWPTSPMSAGTQTITRDISWGPHFDDT